MFDEQSAIDWHSLSFLDRIEILEQIQQKWNEGFEDGHFRDFAGYVEIVMQVLKYIRIEQCMAYAPRIYRVDSLEQYRQVWSKTVYVVGFLENLADSIDSCADEETLLLDPIDISVTHYILYRFFEEGKTVFPELIPMLPDDSAVKDALRLLGERELYESIVRF